MTQVAYTIPQAAAAAGSSEAELRLAIQNGKLTAHVSGDRIIILADDLANYVRRLPTLQSFSAEAKEAVASKEVAAAFARGRAIAERALAPRPTEPGHARGKALAERLLGKDRK